MPHVRKPKFIDSEDDDEHNRTELRTEHEGITTLVKILEKTLETMSSGKAANLEHVEKIIQFLISASMRHWHGGGDQNFRARACRELPATPRAVRERTTRKVVPWLGFCWKHTHVHRLRFLCIIPKSDDIQTW